MGDWTAELVKEHLEAVFDEYRRGHAALHEAEKEAVQVGRSVIDGRLEKLNELRTEVVSDRSDYVRGDVYGPAYDQIRRRTEILELQVAGNTEARSAIAGRNHAIATGVQLFLGATVIFVSLYLGLLHAKTVYVPTPATGSVTTSTTVRPIVTVTP